ncbi:MAG: hypothetical protein NC093_04500 [Alistipes sp.]|nr:hypothetical protein [Alistipes sp.]
MICSVCGTENEKGFKFCVKCGGSLVNPQEVNYEQVDMGNYHSEEEYPENSGGFTMDTGTFVIRDTAPPTPASDSLYTADELNRSEEEFDFSMYDDPAIPALNPIPPKPASQPQQPVHPNGVPLQQHMGMPQMGSMPGMPQPMGMPQPGNMQSMQQMNGMQGMGHMPQMGGMQGMYMNQQAMYAQPQIIGYDQSGMPIYGQPQMMFAQPQIIGYDQNGMPIYGQPQQMMFAQPQIIGYDQNGQPVYGQPQQMMFAQPQIIGYDQNGQPVYGQPQPVMQQPMLQPQQPIQPQPIGMPQMNGMPGMPQTQPVPQMGGIPGMPDAVPEKQEKKKGGDDFWAFFDGDKGKKHEPAPEIDDFFGKAQTAEPDTSSDPFADIDNRRKQRLKQKQQEMGSMGSTPVVDGSKLAANTPDVINKMYMRQTGGAPSADLTVGSGKKHKGEMGMTHEVDASKLASAMNVRSRVSMQASGEVNADALEEYIPEHKEALMAQADHAVEALPKKVNPYESELDKIELPEYMQAKKTVRENAAEIPSLPEIE